MGIGMFKLLFERRHQDDQAAESELAPSSDADAYLGGAIPASE